MSDLSSQPPHPPRDRRGALCVCVERVWHFCREVPDLSAVPRAATRQVRDDADVDGSGGRGQVEVDLSPPICQAFTHHLSGANRGISAVSMKSALTHAHTEGHLSPLCCPNNR